MSHSEDRPRISDADAESLMNAISSLIRWGDEAHAQHVAELEKTVAGLHEVLRDLATHALQLADIKLPNDSPDAAVVADMVERARKVLAYLEPPSH